MALRLPIDDQLERARARLSRVSVAFVIALAVAGVAERCVEENADRYQQRAAVVQCVGWEVVVHGK